jgi:hypothetical protein
MPHECQVRYLFGVFKLNAAAKKTNLASGHLQNATNFTMKFSETFNYYLGLSKDFVFTKQKYSFRT